MMNSIASQVAALDGLTVGQLHERYAEVFGERSRSRHRQYLVRRIAWRLQANAEGGLTERARRRAAELANDADVRVTPPRAAQSLLSSGVAAGAVAGARVPIADSRLPTPGTILERMYRGHRVRVLVVGDGFEHAGRRYRSLSAVAKAITGSHVNGFRFFGLERTR
jgi:hypothetical protein